MPHLDPFELGRRLAARAAQRPDGRLFAELLGCTDYTETEDPARGIVDGSALLRGQRVKIGTFTTNAARDVWVDLERFYRPGRRHVIGHKFAIQADELDLDALAALVGRLVR